MTNDPSQFKLPKEPQESAEWSRQLQPLRWQGWQDGRPALPSRKQPGQRPRWMLLAAAAVLIAVSGWFGSWWSRPSVQPEDTTTASAYSATVLQGAPRLIRSTQQQGRDLSGEEVGGLQVGHRLETPAGSRLRLHVGDIGEVVLEEHSALAIADAGTVDGEYLLQLEKGRLVASIFAEARIFQVGTPAGIAVDLGCIYETEVLEQGRTQLTVLSGQVSFEADGRAVVVPSGSLVWALPGRGPSAPIRRDASPQVTAAWQELVVAEPESTDAQVSLRSLLEHAEAGDAATLWYLLRDGAARNRSTLVTALQELAPPPPSLDLAACSRGEATALEDWRLYYDW